MQPIQVSVIMPVYQVENFLERAIESVLAQSLPSLELILVDDGSTDASGQICDRYALEHPDIISVIHKSNEGLGLARNAGIEAARGAYIAFIDSDDTVDPQMYEAMYAKAQEGDYDIVMCDVEIRYVEEDRIKQSVSYGKETLDLADYLKNGNNITYSVNKLFKRRVWETYRYEKMVFEDIALIPAIITHFPRIGYVPRPFYHYYRRSGTLSTTVSAEMGDIVKAYGLFLERASAAYRDEATLCAACQILGNMTQARPLFKADFITLLQAFKPRFLLNPLIAQDAAAKQLLPFLEQPVIPERFVIADLGERVTPSYLSHLQACFPAAEIQVLHADAFPASQLPQSVRRAFDEGQLAFAEEYFALRSVHERGGIALTADAQPNLNLKRLRLDAAFFGFENDEDLCTHCYGAQAGHHLLGALLDTYKDESIFNQALLPLAQRLRDLLILHFGLRLGGRNQTLDGDVHVYLPSVLAYDMQNGENCCRHRSHAPAGYQLVSDRVLRLWSDRLMENWNLYKRELQNARTKNQAAPPRGEEATMPSSAAAGQISEWEMEERIRTVVERYERSTCWRLTRPIRALGKLLGKD